jgi:UDP:flavonoid glycosyltransferase YjiC (YdhE family)
LRDHPVTRPARIVLATFGSLGDIHPIIALALELQRRGHEPVVATSQSYQEKIAGEGLAFHALRPNLTPDDQELLRAAMDERAGPEHIITRVMMPALGETYLDLLQAVRTADLLVAADLLYAAPIVAEVAKIPWVAVTMAPISFLSRHDPPALIHSAVLRQVARRMPAVYAAVVRLAKWKIRNWGAPVYRLRRELGLPPRCLECSRRCLAARRRTGRRMRA